MEWRLGQLPIGTLTAATVALGFLTPEEFQGFCKGNVIKYNLRLGKKGPAATDSAKAADYQRWLTESLAGTAK